MLAEFEIEGLVDLTGVLGRLSQLNLHGLADDVGELLVSSTQRRFHEEKESPDGVPWPAWSSDYAATRDARHSLLIGGGSEDLRGSIWNYTSGDSIGIGSNLPYAAVHQFGSDEGGGIPARPYLGLSADDRIAIERTAIDLFGEALR